MQLNGEAGLFWSIWSEDLADHLFFQNMWFGWQRIDHVLKSKYRLFLQVDEVTLKNWIDLFMEWLSENELVESKQIHTGIRVFRKTQNQRRPNMGENWLNKVENQRAVIAIICEIVDERDDYKEEGVPRINLMDQKTGILARLKARGHKEEDLPTARELGYSYKRTFAKYLKIDEGDWSSANSHRVLPTERGRQFAARGAAPVPPAPDKKEKPKPAKKDTTPAVKKEPLQLRRRIVNLQIRNRRLRNWMNFHKESLDLKSSGKSMNR